MLFPDNFGESFGAGLAVLTESSETVDAPDIGLTLVRICARDGFFLMVADIVRLLGELVDELLLPASRVGASFSCGSSACVLVSQRMAGAMLSRTVVGTDGLECRQSETQYRYLLFPTDPENYLGEDNEVSWLK